jgi:hypothetical protein
MFMLVPWLPSPPVSGTAAKGRSNQGAAKDRQKASCPPAEGQTDQARKKAAVASGPKFREETPKKGSSTTTPIAVLHCNI